MNARLQTIGPTCGARETCPKRSPITGAVILSPFFWNFRDDMWQTTHHVARALAASIPTLFVEPPVQWNPRSEQFRLHRNFSSCFGPRVETPEPRLNVFHRRGFPLGRLEILRNLQIAGNARALRKILNETASCGKILWHSFPYWSEPLVDSIEREFFVYHCLDYSPREEERRLVERADVVFCVSQALVDKYKTLNRRTFLLPNGVDLDLFDPGRAALLPRPADLPERGPILGFAGYVNCHLDLELLVKVAKAFPLHNVVILGPVAKGHGAPQGLQRQALGQLHSLSNVHLIGFRPPRELPLYLRSFDICLIPHLPDRFNRERDPMKFYQYMAMEKPVVTTPLPVARRYGEACREAGTHEEFIQAVAETLEEKDDETQRLARRAVARRHSWPALVERAWQIIERERAEREREDILEWT